MPSYTTDWTTVNDGDSIVYNTDELTGDETENIHNAEVQWEGISETETEYQTERNEASDSYPHFSGPESLSVAYPPVPDGYDFKQHVAYYAVLDNNGDVDLDGTAEFTYKYGTNTFDGTVNAGSSVNIGDQTYGNSNYVGEDTTLTADFGNSTIDLYVEVWTYGERFVDVTYKTEDPSVSGDVSAGGPTQLNDGEQSAWYSLSGLSAGVDETFNFSINGSNTARFRFTFDYDYATAKPTYGTYAVHYNGTWYEIALADPSDSQLETDEIQVYVNGNWAVLDMVPETYSDSLTVDHIRIWNGSEWLKARVYNTRSV